MKPKFTPGPWFVSSDDAIDCSEHANSGLAMVDTGRQDDFPIARLCEWNNARLIAAAPELYEALDSIARNTCCDKCQEAALVARAALAKVDA